MPNLHETLIDLFHEISRLLHQNVHSVFQNLPVPPAAWMLAHHIEHHPGLTVSELARRTSIAKSHVSTVLEDLSQRGWIDKRQDPADHRLVRIYPAEQASEHMRRVHADIKHRLTEVVAIIPEDQAARLITDLQYFRNALKAASAAKTEPHERR